jgi:hypothetical protein
LEIVAKEYPYSECTNQAQIYKKVTSGIRPNALSKVQDESIRTFIELCLTFDPKDRPGASEVLQHPFLTSMDPSTSAVNLFEGMSTDAINTLQQQPQYQSNSQTALTQQDPQGTLERPSKLSTNLHPTPPKSDTPSLSAQSQDSPTTNTQSVLSKNLAAHSSSPVLSKISLDERTLVYGSPTVVDAENHTYVISERVSSTERKLSLKRNSQGLSEASSAMQSTSEQQESLSGAHSLQRQQHSSLQPLMLDSSIPLCQVEALDWPSEDEVTFRMTYGPPGGPISEMMFPFKLSEDTATDVVAEMIRENLILQSDETLARRKLEEAVRVILLGQIRSTSVEPRLRMGTPVLNSPKILPAQGIPVPAADSPTSSSHSTVNPLLGSSLNSPLYTSTSSPQNQPPLGQTQQQNVKSVLLPQQLTQKLTESPGSSSMSLGTSSYSTRSPVMIPTASAVFADQHQQSNAPSKPGHEPQRVSIQQPMNLDPLPNPAISPSEKLSLASAPLSKIMDPAVQNKLKELQELNLKGLGTLGINSSFASAANKPKPTRQMSAYTTASEPWPVTFGTNQQQPQQQQLHQGASPLVRTQTLPNFGNSVPVTNALYPQGGGTLPRSHNLQAPLIPRPIHPPRTIPDGHSPSSPSFPSTTNPFLQSMNNGNGGQALSQSPILLGSPNQQTAMQFGASVAAAVPSHHHHHARHRSLSTNSNISSVTGVSSEQGGDELAVNQSTSSSPL